MDRNLVWGVGGPRAARGEHRRYHGIHGRRNPVGARVVGENRAAATFGTPGGWSPAGKDRTSPSVSYRWTNDMIDIRKLKELIKLMVENDLSDLDLQDQQETVSIKRGRGGEPMVHQPQVVPAATAEAAGSSSNSSPAGSQSDMAAIESPMVGTFYSAANPDSAPFVKVGDQISSDTVVCMVEAMKVIY
ncbi:MAG: hypothetical protein IH985_01550, partial [Planctomycetes bacterium]|nr:hypothetical protein [Planctomycetota bacterium]